MRDSSPAKNCRKSWLTARRLRRRKWPLRPRKGPYDACGRIGAGWGWQLADVRLQDGETVENALRRFKRQVIQENIIGEVKRHSFYLKPGQKLRVKQALARKRNRKKARREPE